VTPRGDVMSLLPEPTAEESFDVVVCAEIAPEAVVRGRSERVRLPAVRCAAVRHVGAYEELGLAYHALFAWAQERGHAEAGPLREIYRNDPREVAPEALVTDVLLPVL
jgi:effector-binding domain-containing protein